ncbi:hypothetical protein Q1695_014225 [Nippostrongylus brasiliensis]|nr:hypothetical protein Q1695_014225 [Nippostrongylus brasiliensis]
MSEKEGFSNAENDDEQSADLPFSGQAEEEDVEESEKRENDSEELEHEQTYQADEEAAQERICEDLENQEAPPAEQGAEPADQSDQNSEPLRSDSASPMATINIEATEHTSTANIIEESAESPVDTGPADKGSPFSPENDDDQPDVEQQEQEKNLTELPSIEIIKELDTESAGHLDTSTPGEDVKEFEEESAVEPGKLIDEEHKSEATEIEEQTMEEALLYAPESVPQRKTDEAPEVENLDHQENRCETIGQETVHQENQEADSGPPHNNSHPEPSREESNGVLTPIETHDNVQHPTPVTETTKPEAEKPKETPVKSGAKPQSRLVRPQARLIHTAPQSATPTRTQSATRPSTGMPKPTPMPRPEARTIRPPAPRPVPKSSSKEQLNKKPSSRAQSQPRPNGEPKAASQTTTPKVYRKVVTVSSKVGSFTDHKPQGGNVQIFSESKTYNAASKVGSLHNVTHTPGGGNVKILNMKLDFKEKAKPKIDAKSEHIPAVPEKKMITQKLNWNAQSKVGSLDNVKHKPAGGNVQIFDERIQYVSSTNSKSKSGSLGNVSSQSRTASRNAIDLINL